MALGIRKCADEVQAAVAEAVTRADVLGVARETRDDDARSDAGVIGGYEGGRTGDLGCGGRGSRYVESSW